MEKQEQEQEKLYTAIAKESRKQLAEESYTSWLCQNSLSSIEPPGNAMSRLYERQQSNKLHCTSCPKTMEDTSVTGSKVAGQSHSVTASAYSSQSSFHAYHNANYSHIKVAPIRISLKQSYRNVESIGKPDMMFPYTNYPPLSYKQNHPKQARSKSTRPSSSMSNHFRRPRSRAIKSAPTPCIMHTPDPSSLASLKECATTKSRRKKKSVENGHTDTSMCSKVDSDVLMSECNEKPQEMEPCNNNKQEEDIDAVDPLEEGDGSTSSIDFTFHEVGPENNLQSLAATAGSLSPTELLTFLRISNSSQQKKHNFKKSQSYPHQSTCRSLSAIPEGEIVMQYEDQEGSQLFFDTNFLYSLMPYAFEDTDFQGIDANEITRILANNNILTEGTLSDHSTSAGATPSDSTSTEKPLVVAWDDNSDIKQKIQNSTVQQNSLEYSSESAGKTFPHAKRKVHSAMPKLQQCFLKQNRTVLKTSVVQFDGNN